MIKIFLIDRRFRGLRAIVIAISLTSLIILFYQKFSFSCQLLILQNGILPFIVVQQFLVRIEELATSDRIKTGIVLGGFIGAFVAAFYLLLSNIQYYLLGGRELAINFVGGSTTPLTIRSILIGIQSDFGIWIGLIILSVIAGIIGAISTSGRVR